MDRHHPRFVFLNRRSLFVSLVIIASLALAAPALAEYLGPDRETTVFKEVHVPEKDVWPLTHVDPDDGFADVCLIIHTCEEHPSVERQEALCGWVADNSGCTEWWEEQEVTITLPEATIDSVLQNCHLVDSWCTNSPTVRLTGTEPVDGEVITLIEGTRNGETFACPGDSCDLPGLEGENSLTFWAHSSWGDTSQMGTLSFKVDSEGPFIGIPDSWYIWEPLAIAVDDDHGVEQVSLTIHGGSYGNRHYQWNLANLPNNWIWDRYFGDIVAPIGNYPVTIDAEDGLGNVSTEHATIMIPVPETDTEALASLVEGDDGAGGDTQSDESTSAETTVGEEQAAASQPEAGAETGAETGASAPDASESQSQTSDQGPQAAAEAGADPAAGTVSEQPQAVVAPSSEGGSSGVLWGAAALAAIAGATAYGLNRKKEREAEIEAKRKEIAERRSERSFADHLQSLRHTAEARIAPIRAAIISSRNAAVAAAAAAAAAEHERLAGERADRLQDRLGDQQDSQDATQASQPNQDSSSDQHPSPEDYMDSWQRAELLRARSYTGYGQGPGEVADQGGLVLPEIPPLPVAFEGQIPMSRITLPTSPLASTTYQVGGSLTLRTLAEGAAITTQLTPVGLRIPMPKSVIGDWSVKVDSGGITVSQSTEWLTVAASASHSGASSQLRWKSTWGVGQYDGEFGSRTTVDLESRVLIGEGDVSHMSASLSGTSHFRPQNLLLYGAVGLAVLAVTVGVAPLAAAASAAAASLGFAFNQLSAAFGG